MLPRKGRVPGRVTPPVTNEGRAMDAAQLLERLRQAPDLASDLLGVVILEGPAFPHDDPFEEARRGFVLVCSGNPRSDLVEGAIREIVGEPVTIRIVRSFN